MTPQEVHDEFHSDGPIAECSAPVCRQESARLKVEAIPDEIAELRAEHEHHRLLLRNMLRAFDVERLAKALREHASDVGFGHSTESCGEGCAQFILNRLAEDQTWLDTASVKRPR